MNAGIIVSISVASREEASSIGRALLAERLAACVQCHPVTSWFRWNSEIREEDEFMLVVKSRVDLFPAIEQRVLALHSYDVPEIIATPILAGHGPYLNWIASETAQEE